MQRQVQVLQQVRVLQRSRRHNLQPRWRGSMRNRASIGRSCSSKLHPTSCASFQWFVHQRCQRLRRQPTRLPLYSNSSWFSFGGTKSRSGAANDYWTVRVPITQSASLIVPQTLYTANCWPAKQAAPRQSLCTCANIVANKLQQRLRMRGGTCLDLKQPRAPYDPIRQRNPAHQP